MLLLPTLWAQSSSPSSSLLAGRFSFCTRRMAAWLHARTKLFCHAFSSPPFLSISCNSWNASLSSTSSNWSMNASKSSCSVKANNSSSSLISFFSTSAWLRAHAGLLLGFPFAFTDFVCDCADPGLSWPAAAELLAFACSPLPRSPTPCEPSFSTPPSPAPPCPLLVEGFSTVDCASPPPSLPAAASQTPPPPPRPCPPS
mmetsp:Transcript_19130/g.53552  ORF Transcript_19130/g.53552 Transcript_19130/m.53552 type:complete len:200 (-) Transcript_19130:1647-2246(-)